MKIEYDESGSFIEIDDLIVRCPKCNQEIMSITGYDGYIYVLWNESLPELLKIGMTTRDPETRARELSSQTGVPGDFQILATYAVNNVSYVEKKIHDKLADLRVNGKEFFKCRLEDVGDTLLEILNPVLISVNDSLLHRIQMIEQKKEEEKRMREEYEGLVIQQQELTPDADVSILVNSICPVCGGKFTPMENGGWKCYNCNSIVNKTIWPQTLVELFKKRHCPLCNHVIQVKKRKREKILFCKGCGSELHFSRVQQNQ